MNKTEKEYIANMEEKYRPIGAWKYFGYNILFSLPVIGFIIMLITALGSGNINARSYARSFFCVYIIVIVFVIVLASTGILAAVIASITGAATT